MDLLLDRRCSRRFCKHLQSTLLTVLFTVLQPDVVQAEDHFEGLRALDVSSLAELRGGVLTDSGLQLALAFESIVFIDGELQVHSALEIPKIALDQRVDNRELSVDLELISVSQTGVGNSISPGVLQNLSSGLTSIVQNNLDRHVIEHLKILNIQLSGLGLAQHTPLRSILTPQLIQSLR